MRNLPQCSLFLPISGLSLGIQQEHPYVHKNQLVMLSRRSDATATLGSVSQSRPAKLWLAPGMPMYVLQSCPLRLVDIPCWRFWPVFRQIDVDTSESKGVYPRSGSTTYCFVHLTRTMIASADREIPSSRTSFLVHRFAQAFHNLRMAEDLQADCASVALAPICRYRPQRSNAKVNGSPECLTSRALGWRL